MSLSACQTDMTYNKNQIRMISGLLKVLILLLIYYFLLVNQYCNRWFSIIAILLCNLLSYLIILLF